MLDPIREDVLNIREGLRDVKEDVQNLKEDVQNLKEDMQNLNTRSSTFHITISYIKNKVYKFLVSNLYTSFNHLLINLSFAISPNVLRTEFEGRCTEFERRYAEFERRYADCQRRCSGYHIHFF